MLKLDVKVKRPIVRWHGGKWMLADWIISNFPEHRIYVEPFGGGASVLLRKPRSYAEIYNDMDGEIVNLFRVMRDMGAELKEKLILTPFAKDEFTNSYKPTNDPLEQARRTISRSFMGFGSNSHNKKTGFRSNANRAGTTPAHDWTNYPEKMADIIDRLKGVVIENSDALKIMQQHDSPETLHYVDPPYVLATRDKGSDYRFEMNDDDHRALADGLKKLTGTVILSGYRCDLYDELYSEWARIDRKAHADGARARVESLWLSGPTRQAQLFGDQS